MLRSLLRNAATKMKAREWIHTMILAGNEFLKSRPNYQMSGS